MLQFILWFDLKTDSGHCNQGLLDLVVVLVGSNLVLVLVFLECVVLFAFLGGAGPRSLSPRSKHVVPVTEGKTCVRARLHVTVQWA